MALTPTQLDRYKRHILLKEIGGAGQQALLRARVLIVGMGGLGNPLAQYLAAAGVGTLGLVDDDCVDLSNLQRQILFETQDIGARKVDAAAARLKALNPDVEIICHPQRVDAQNAGELVGQYGLIALNPTQFQPPLSTPAPSSLVRSFECFVLNEHAPGKTAKGGKAKILEISDSDSVLLDF